MQSLRRIVNQNALLHISSPVSTIPRHSIARSIVTSRSLSKTPFQSSKLTKTLFGRTNTSSPLRIPLRTRRRLFSSEPKPPTNPSPSEPSSPSLSQRLRKLSREYGWSALGVYLALTALDFPFCFLAVRWLGTERIGRWEHVVIDAVKGVVKWPLGGGQQERDNAVRDGKAIEEGGAGETFAEPRDTGGIAAIVSHGTEDIFNDHGYKEAEEANEGEGASLWTQLALAYAIHKSFIFIRVPLTAALTPKVVRVLRSWGWDVGKRRPKGVKGPEK